MVNIKKKNLTWTQVYNFTKGEEGYIQVGERSLMDGGNDRY
jgi:hypothetical protein